MSSHDANDEPANRMSSDHADDGESNRTLRADTVDELPNEGSNQGDDEEEFD
jgi:hypothetical protein